MKGVLTVICEVLWLQFCSFFYFLRVENKKIKKTYTPKKRNKNNRRKWNKIYIWKKIIPTEGILFDISEN
jgi:hypothetical protein